MAGHARYLDRSTSRVTPDPCEPAQVCTFANTRSVHRYYSIYSEVYTPYVAAPPGVRAADYGRPTPSPPPPILLQNSERANPYHGKTRADPRTKGPSSKLAPRNYRCTAAVAPTPAYPMHSRRRNRLLAKDNTRLLCQKRCISTAAPEVSLCCRPAGARFSTDPSLVNCMIGVPSLTCARAGWR